MQQQQPQLLLQVALVALQVLQVQQETLELLTQEALAQTEVTHQMQQQF